MQSRCSDSEIKEPSMALEFYWLDFDPVHTRYNLTLPPPKSLLLAIKSPTPTLNPHHAWTLAWSLSSVPTHD